MTEHTKGPWEIRPSGVGTMIYATDGNGHLLATLPSEYSQNHLANAERIIACVSACEGVLNEELKYVKLKDVL